MKNLKKFLFIISCISACISLFFIVNTYSRYVTSATGTAEISIAKWNIKINDLTIKNNSNLSNVITPVFPGTEHIQKDIIAPTSEGYFDLNMDYSSADVSFDYVITVTPNANSSVSDLIATGYSIDDGEIISIAKNSSITGTGFNTDASKSKKFRIYIKWDDENGSMNNAADTAATIPANATTLLNVNISFTQKAK